MTFRRNHVDELISASLTGELTDAERLELDAHLVRCETCRATLAAFSAERRILSGLPLAEPPRDLSARVRTGIESRSGRRWWRPGSMIAVGATLATVAAALLAVVVFNNVRFDGVGQQSGTPVPSGSLAAAPSAVETTAPSTAPTPVSVPALALGPGELGYLSLTGAPQEALRLSFVNDATGEALDAGTVTGPPIAAALSPNGEWLAYITQKGESGANEVWALHLADGQVVPLGCTDAASFTDRLAWSPDGTYLAFTLIAIDLGADSGCPPNQGAPETADAWVYDASLGERFRLTGSGNAYSASFQPGERATLLISHAAESPWSEAVPLAADPTDLERIDGVFLPLFSLDGSRAIFWNGTMTLSGGSWHFSLGGLPQLSKDFRSAGPASPWIGTPLFTDLTPAGGEAFASGTFAWGPDSDRFAFWNGSWTGVPQSADGTYPNQFDVYIGAVSAGLLTVESRLPLQLADVSRIVGVALSPADEAAVTLGFASAGVGDPPSAYLQVIPFDGVDARTVWRGAEPPPWNGPAVYGD